jgi:tetratricopeptide (TPR) repeat protein
MVGSHFFVSYSRVDGETHAIRLADRLTAGPPSIDTWLDRRRLQPGIDWDDQIVEALRTCAGLLFVMTEDSVGPRSECKKEWTRALKYKKPVIPLLFHPDAELPYRLEPREYIDFASSFEAGLARLRDHVRWRTTPEGVLRTSIERLEDAKRDISRSQPDEKARIEEEIVQLERQIGEQRRALDNPEAADRLVKTSIERGLERERAPERPISGVARTRFVNAAPFVPPAWFQDRHVETGLIGDFLRDDALRMMIVVGRGGVGKTAMVCRLLKALEGGRLPDDLGPLAVDGIVYLSAAGAHRVNFPNVFADLGRLLPDETAQRLDQLYRDPRQSTEAQVSALLEAFPNGRSILLLDNFEDVVDIETFAIKEGELEECLRTLLKAPQHGVKVIITTRLAPRHLLLVEPARQRRLDLDEGLRSPYAENILRAMDADGRLGLKTESETLLAKARERTRGYPRALEALVAILAVDRETSLAEVLQDTARLLPENVVDALVGEAFNRLDPLAQQVMQALAVYGVPVPPVAVDYLLQPYFVGINSGPVLGRLVNMQFARRDAGRYYLHQVDREYALSRIPEGRAADRDATDPRLYTRYALLHRGAEYFKETRRPRETWKALDDLVPQLAEFELRCAGHDYDRAASVLGEIDFHYLFLWGHYRLLVDLHERLQGKVQESDLALTSMLRLGNALYGMGQYDRAIRSYEEALALARRSESRGDQGKLLGNLAICYSDLGEVPKAIDYTKQSLAIAVEVGSRKVEAVQLVNLGVRYSDIGQTAEAIGCFEQALTLNRQIGNRAGECHTLANLADLYADLSQPDKARDLVEQARTSAVEISYRLVEVFANSISGRLLRQQERWAEAIPAYEEAVRLADEIGSVRFQMTARRDLARALTRLGDFERARLLSDEASRYLYPSGFSSVLALQGILAMRQADREGARSAFEAAIAHADDLLRRGSQNWSPASARALAFAGLSLCKDASLVATAVDAYRNARAINSNAGVVKEMLQDLDVLAAMDPTGLLKPVRAACAGEA